MLRIAKMHGSIAEKWHLSILRCSRNSPYERALLAYWGKVQLVRALLGGNPGSLRVGFLEVKWSRADSHSKTHEKNWLSVGTLYSSGSLWRYDAI